MNRAKPWTCLAISLVACLSAMPAFAGLTHKAVETSASNIVLPSTPNGTIVLKPCDKCALTSIVVTPQSRYFIGGQEVTLQEMVVQTKRAEGMSLVISYDPKTLELVTIKGWL
jgi:hypothetical protein